MICDNENTIIVKKNVFVHFISILLFNFPSNCLHIWMHLHLFIAAQPLVTAALNEMRKKSSPVISTLCWPIIDLM